MLLIVNRMCERNHQNKLKPNFVISERKMIMASLFSSDALWLSQFLPFTFLLSVFLPLYPFISGTKTNPVTSHHRL